MSIPYGEIEPVSASRTRDESWELAFKIAQAPALPLVGMDVRRYSLLSAQDDILKLALHQVYRQHWDSKHKFPCRLKKLERQAIEIYGNYWWEVLKLCERLHSHQNFGEPYVNAAWWFLRLILEYRHIKANSDSNVSKTDLADLITEELKQLRKGDNPYSTDFEPHRARLIDAAQSLANSDQFNRYNWQPFLRAYAAWRDDLRENPSWYAVVKDKNGKYYNQGRGRVKILTLCNS